MSQLINITSELIEKASRPGVLGLPGMKVERSLARDLKQYFEELKSVLASMSLESKDWSSLSKDMARHVIEHALHNALRKQRGDLQGSLELNIEKAYNVASKLQVMHEAVGDSPIDKTGQTALKAADYAKQQAADLVTGLDDTTIGRIANAVSDGIEQQLSSASTARLITAAIDDMTVIRALTIAATEINRAMSQATLDKLTDLEIEYKQWIPDADPCPICTDNVDAGPIPVDEDFPSGDAAPPAHPNCRCAVAGARGPDDN